MKKEKISLRRVYHSNGGRGPNAPFMLRECTVYFKGSAGGSLISLHLNKKTRYSVYTSVRGTPMMPGLSPDLQTGSPIREPDQRMLAVPSYND